MISRIPGAGKADFDKLAGALRHMAMADGRAVAGTFPVCRVVSKYLTGVGRGTRSQQATNATK